MPEINAMAILNKWYGLTELVTFLAAAAGKTKSALIIKIPTHWILNATTIANITAKMDSTAYVFIPRLRAKVLFTDEIKSLLKSIDHKIKTAMKTAAK